MISFRLHESKAPTVVNAAVAIIRQLIIWLFEKMAEEEADTGNVVPVQRESGAALVLQRSCADAFVIFQDVCLLSNDQKPLVLGLKTIDKAFGLELIESVLAYHGATLKRNAHFVAVIRDKVCTLAVRKLNEKYDFAQGCRLWRLVSLLLRDFRGQMGAECEVLFSYMRRVLDESTVVWERCFVLELAGTLLGDYGVWRELLEMCVENHHEHFFRDLLLAINNHILAGIGSAEMVLAAADIKIPWYSVPPASLTV